MSQGIAIPVRTNKRGGAQLIQATPYLDQTIRAGLTPNTSKNPFQRGQGVDIGIPERVIFQPNNVQASALVRRAITRFFRVLKAKELAKLATGKDGILIKGAQENLIASIKYIDLEADSQRDLSSNLRTFETINWSI